MHKIGVFVGFTVIFPAATAVCHITDTQHMNYKWVKNGASFYVSAVQSTQEQTLAPRLTPPLLELAEPPPPPPPPGKGELLAGNRHTGSQSPKARSSSKASRIREGQELRVRAGEAGQGREDGPDGTQHLSRRSHCRL